MKWTEARVQDLLYRWTPQGTAYLPNNTGLFGWEADFILVTRSFYAREYEIKVDRADLMGELKCAAWSASGHGQPRRSYKKVWKHRRLSGQFTVRYKSLIPSHFTIVVPHPYTDLISDEEIEELFQPYMGLMEIENTFARCRVVRKSPRIPGCRALSMKELAAVTRGMNLRYWEMRRSL